MQFVLSELFGREFSIPLNGAHRKHMILIELFQEYVKYIKL